MNGKTSSVVDNSGNKKYDIEITEVDNNEQAQNNINDLNIESTDLRGSLNINTGRNKDLA